MKFFGPSSIQHFVEKWVRSNAATLKDKTIIDLPAGSGRTSNCLQQIGAKVEPYDLFPEFFDVADLTCQKADLMQSLPMASQHADYIICQEGIEHIPDQLTLLREFAPLAGILQLAEYRGRLYFVRKAQSVKWLERILFHRFTEAGLNIIPAKGGLQQICDTLANNDAVIFTFDQSAKIYKKDAIAVPFLGEPAGTFKSLAVIANRMQAPVVPIHTYRRSDGKHVMELLDPIPWQSHENRKTEIYENTLAYNQALEKMVLTQPEQWLWLYKRWRLPKQA